MKALTTFLFLVSACGSDVHVLDGTDAATTGDAGDIDRDAAGLDGGMDAGRLPSDAALGEPYYYRLVPANVDFFVTPEMCDSYEGVDKRFLVMQHWFSSCQEPGPIEVDVDEPRTVTIRGWNWELVGPADCRAIGAAVPRSVFVQGLYNGTWMVNWDGGSAEIEVGGAPPPITCIDPGPSGTSCLANCDCTEGRCVAPSNDGMCGARTCQQVCNSWVDAPGFHPECPPGRECAPDPVHGNTCQNARADLCRGPADCPRGTRCESDSDFAAHCVWDVTLSGAARRACSSNAECAPGLDCVQPLEHAPPEGYLGTCEVRCRTSEQSCPSMHACASPTVPGTPLNRSWVCEWLGE